MASTSNTPPEPIQPEPAPTVAEPNAGPMPASFAQAILDNYAWRLAFDQPVYRHQGVATFGPGDPVPSDHPAFASMAEQGLLAPILRDGQEPPTGWDAMGNRVPVDDGPPIDAAAADAALAKAGKPQG